MDMHLLAYISDEFCTTFAAKDVPLAEGRLSAYWRAGFINRCRQSDGSVIVAITRAGETAVAKWREDAESDIEDSGFSQYEFH